MAKYCFFVVMPVPKDKIEKWKEVGALSSQIFRDCGAVATYDWIADIEACPMGEVTSFQRSVQATEDEVIGIAQVIFESKEVRIPRDLAGHSTNIWPPIPRIWPPLWISQLSNVVMYDRSDCGQALCG
jgi:uncharacterized protein YbaA (DUF1428 family)